MPLSNIEPKKTVTALTNSEYSIDPDLLDIIKGFFESKGFNSVTADILATNMITSAIDAGNVTREDLLDTIRRGGDVLEVKSLEIQKAGTGYVSGDILRFKYPGIVEEIEVKVLTVGTNGAIQSINLERAGIIETKPRNPMSASYNSGIGRGAFFIAIYQNTFKPNAELSQLASYLLNTSRFPSSFTGITDTPESNKVFTRLVV